MALAEWLGLLGLPLMVLLRRGVDPVRTLRLRPTGVRTALGAVFMGGAGPPVAWTVSWIQAPWVSPDPAVVETFGRDLLPTGPAHLGLLILLAVVTPAVCEEFALRGLLLEGLRRRAGVGWAVGISATVFGLLHGSAGAASRILPAVALGLILGWAVLRAGTLVAGVLLHLTHNLVVLLSAAALAGRTGALDIPAAPPAHFLLTGVVCLALGIHLLGASASDSPPHHHRT